MDDQSITTLHDPNAAPRPILGRLILLAFITGFSGAMMPGPFLVAVIEQTAIQGMRAVLGLLTGHALLELVFIALLALGLRRVIARTKVRAAIGLIGGFALLYMSGDMIWHARSLTLNLSAHAGGAHAAAAYSWPKLIVFGAAVCIVNPYFTGWWSTIGAGQIAHMAPRTTVDYLGFYVGHEFADIAWYSLVGLIIITSRRWLTDGIYQWLILACGTLLFLVGVWFLATGWRLIRSKAA
jgi:threonine/homoserine/homoserine lactone efflux protein